MRITKEAFNTMKAFHADMLENQKQIENIPHCTCGECPTPTMNISMSIEVYNTLAATLGLFLGVETAPKEPIFDWETARQGMAFFWETKDDGGVVYFMGNHPLIKNQVIAASETKYGLNHLIFMDKKDLFRCPENDLKIGNISSDKSKLEESPVNNGLNITEEPSPQCGCFHCRLTEWVKG